MTIESVFHYRKPLNGQRDQSQTGKVARVTKLLTKICGERGLAETCRDGSISTNEENTVPGSGNDCIAVHLLGIDNFATHVEDQGEVMKNA